MPPACALAGHGSALRPEQVTLTFPEKWKSDTFPPTPVARAV